jgi:hypothetical protein
VRRFDRLVRLPRPLRHALVFLGVAWLIAGWVFGVVPWIVGLAFAAAYALTVRRRVESVTLQPYSKERGTVIWSYRKNDVTTGPPRLVWDEPEPDKAPDAS